MSKDRKNTPASALENVRQYIATESAMAAAIALTEVCRSTKASPQAKASAGSALLRASGLFDKPSEKLIPRDPHEMTADEIAAELDRLERAALKRQSEADGRDAFA
ncbi:hypothetical protein AB4037_14045 [Labrys sp. KB_33_2]|uniref:hypothetical protein n=1 Tax=Labrys sp. KB_33_2 TaxID=3237479 RepID=UPI003F92F823